MRLSGEFKIFIFFIKKSYTQKKHKKQTRDIHSTSIVNVTIRRVSDFYFFMKKFYTQKSIKSKQATSTQIFLYV